MLVFPGDGKLVLVVGFLELWILILKKEKIIQAFICSNHFLLRKPTLTFVNIQPPSQKPPISRLPQPSPLKTTLNHIHETPIKRITHPPKPTRVERRSGRVPRRLARKRRRTPVGSDPG